MAPSARSFLSNLTVAHKLGFRAKVAPGQGSGEDEQ